VRALTLAAVTLGLLPLVPSAARADGLSGLETARLLRGESVARSQTVNVGQRSYVGGVSYVILDEPAEDVTHLLADVNVWKRLLPKTRSARRVGGAGQDTLVELTNGTLFLQATYTMRLRREGAGVKFWLDRSKHHDVEDVWGFLRVEPMTGGRGRSLVTYGVLIDVGDGVARDLFEGPVRELAMSVPDHLRNLVLERAAAGQSASR
jgi:hypothetical protein